MIVLVTAVAPDSGDSDSDNNGEAECVGSPVMVMTLLVMTSWKRCGGSNGDCNGDDSSEMVC